MGISKRNPRGNFNWQSRILKKNAVNCGQLNEPFDCKELAPLLTFNPTKFCISDPPENITISSNNYAINQFFDNTFELYKDGILIDTQFIPFGGYNYVITSATAADEGLYEIKVTNRFGCQASISEQITAYDKPYFTVSTVGSTIPCIFNPPGVDPPTLGDGSITVTIDNPVVGQTYAYTLYWDSAIAIYDILATGQGASYTFNNLCNIRYLVLVGVEISGGSSRGECQITQTVDLA